MMVPDPYMDPTRMHHELVFWALARSFATVLRTFGPRWYIRPASDISQDDSGDAGNHLGYINRRGLHNMMSRVPLGCRASQAG